MGPLAVSVSQECPSGCPRLSALRPKGAGRQAGLREDLNSFAPSYQNLISPPLEKNNIKAHFAANETVLSNQSRTRRTSPQTAINKLHEVKTGSGLRRVAPWPPPSHRCFPSQEALPVPRRGHLSSLKGPASRLDSPAGVSLGQVTPHPFKRSQRGQVTPEPREGGAQKGGWQHNVTSPL